VAGAVADAEQDRFVLSPSPRQGLVAPGVPIDRIVRVFQQVRTRLVRQAIAHHTTLRPSSEGPAEWAGWTTRLKRTVLSMLSMPGTAAARQRALSGATALVFGGGLALYQATSLVLGPPAVRQLPLSLSIPVDEPVDRAEPGWANAPLVIGALAPLVVAQPVAGRRATQRHQQPAIAPAVVHAAPTVMPSPSAVPRPSAPPPHVVPSPQPPLTKPTTD